MSWQRQWRDPLRLIDPSAPPLAEQMYVDEHIRLLGFPGISDGRYEIVHRTPLTHGLRLVLEPAPPSSASIQPDLGQHER